jgi:hypothetical protein
MVFEKRLLRIISGPKREEVVRGWRRLHNEELHNLCASPNIIMVIKSRRIRWVEYVAQMVEMRNAYSILAGKPEGKRPSERPRLGWEDNIRMDLRKVWWECVDRIHLAQERDQWQALVCFGFHKRQGIS